MTDIAPHVDVWIVDADQLIDSGSVDEGDLPQGELSRYTRIRRAEVRRRAIAIRWALRNLLGKYMRVHPSALRIEAGRHGKPQLPAISNRGELQFNVSHSGYLGLIAVGRGMSIGVDLERICSLDVDGLASTALSAMERPAFESLSLKDQRDHLLRTWVAKEAALKASGLGLSLSPDRLAIEQPAGDGAVLRLCRIDDERLKWTARRLVPMAGFEAAVAFEGIIDPPALRTMAVSETLRCLGLATRCR